MRKTVRLTGSTVKTSHTTILQDGGAYKLNTDNSEAYDAFSCDDESSSPSYKIYGFDFSTIPNNATVTSLSYKVKLATDPAGIRYTQFWTYENYVDSRLDVTTEGLVYTTNLRIEAFWDRIIAKPDKVFINIIPNSSTSSVMRLYGAEVDVEFEYEPPKNKVVYFGKTLIDLTADTVIPETLMQGYTAHDASGATIVGTATKGGEGSAYQDEEGYIILGEQGDGSSITVDALSVTENGTYTAPTGHAYSPVTVNVNGGGGGDCTLVLGVIRPDAEIVQSWTYDRYIVADEGVTIPAYTTSATTLKASASLAQNIALDYDDYAWILAFRALVTPIYSEEEPSIGLQDCYIATYLWEIVRRDSLDNSAYSSQPNTATTLSGTTYGLYRYVPHGSFLTREFATVQYGAYIAQPPTSLASPTVTDPYPKLTLASPNLMLRGNTSYMNSAHWELLTDIRYQYVYELYRAPNGNLNFDGFGAQSQVNRVISCRLGTGTLT